MNNTFSTPHARSQMNAASKTALVLAGGGLTGAVYEIGALRAIDDLLVDRTVNDFDIYVGTSAGSLVAAGLANGFSPEMMLQAMDGSHAAIQPVVRRDILRFNTRELVQRSLGLPGLVSRAWSHYVRHAHDMTLFDMLWSLLETLPSAFYDSGALERYVGHLLAELGGSNTFAALNKQLHIIATDLDTGERAVFSQDEHSHVPISQAVAASSALPVLYTPVRIGDAEYVDGAIRGNASLDLAIEQGAKLVLCINPLVPYDHREEEALASRMGTAREGSGGRAFLSERGMQAVASQVFRTLTHAGLHYHIKQLRRSHPDVDIILIEPRADDYLMSFYNIMRYSTRLIVARHGFEAVTIDLAEEYARYKEILARHGIPLSRRLVIEELAEIRGSGYDEHVIRRVLESRPSASKRQGEERATHKLTRALAELDLVLTQMAGEVA
ncbi:MAG: patatin-like phospholipase family protein [Anaerolineae bacterium]